MSERTLEAPVRTEVGGGPPTPKAGRTRQPLPWVRRHPWWVVGAVLVLFSEALIRWAGTSPSYDAYGWLVWGHQTLRLSLDLGGAPSWKPLPYVFTVPFAVFGHFELALWMVTAVALSFAGCLFAGRIAYRVILAGDPSRSRAAISGATFAGVAVLGLWNYLHYILSVQSDPVIVTLVLAGVDAHLHGRRAWAFWLGVLAGLGRPEVWCLLGPYTIYLWVRERNLRWMLVGGWGVTAFMWFGIPTITNLRPFVSAQLAMGSPRELKSNQITGTIARFHELQFLPLWLATLGTFAWAWVRRERTVIALCLAAGLWLVTEIAFALHGWPGLPRYMFEAGALCAVVAGIGFGWLLADGPALRPDIPRWAGPVVAGILVLALLPGARARYDHESADLTHERARSGEINWLRDTFAAIGGVQHIRSCGQPVINVEWASALAYYMGMDVGFVGYRPAWEKRQRNPTVLFEPIPGGWHVLPWHLRRADRARCANLHVYWRHGTPAHPAGTVVRL